MKRKKYKIIVFFLVVFISFFLTIKYLIKNDFDLDNNTIELLLETSGNINPKNRIINTIVTTIKESNIINPVSTIIDAYNYDSNEIKTIPVNSVFAPSYTSEPLVYIYNTHQIEAYNGSKEININYTVLDASFYLQKRLKQLNIDSIVETNSIKDILTSNNWNYASSYKVSRMFLEKRKSDNKSLKYYIDIHRDSVNKNISTITINNKKYAKILFLLGLDNEKYKNNEKNIQKLENWVNKNYKGLSRGIYKKSGKGVNGIYNQDFSENCFLIEIGGEENTYEEVENTIDVIAEMIKDMVGGHLE